MLTLQLVKDKHWSCFPVAYTSIDKGGEQVSLSQCNEDKAPEASARMTLAIRKKIGSSPFCGMAHGL
jgi:hypothetical protein